MESIRLDALAMKQFNLSPEEANGLIMAGRIWIGHVPADKPGASVPADTVLTLLEKEKKYEKVVSLDALYKEDKKELIIKAVPEELAKQILNQ